MPKTFSSYQQAAQAFNDHRAMFVEAGVYLPPGAQSYVWDEVRRNALAMDAQPSLTTSPNTGIPAFLTTLIDPEVYHIIFTPTKGAEVLGELRKGTWVDQTAMFPVVEQTGEVSSYGDFNTNGRSGANMAFPQRQSYLFQTISEYGELEVARAGLGKVNWVGEIDGAGTTVLHRFLNQTYFFGVQGLQNYGLLNDPNLSAPLTPITKAAGGNKWVTNGVVTATANEIFTDIQSLWYQLQGQQAFGLVDQNTAMTLALSPGSELALTATNSFGVNVADLLKKNFPNLKIVSAPQYGQTTATNPGVAAGNLVQLIATAIEGQKTGYCSFNEKLRAHPIIRDLSSWKKKMTSGTWGAILRQPMGIAQMLGV